MEKRDILIYLSIKYEGNWDLIRNALEINEKIESIDEVDKMVKSLTCKAVTLLDSDYPGCLKTIYKPPIVIFYDGDLSLIKNYNNCVSIVGSRNNSIYGERITRQLVKDICKFKIIVSGLALGIDAIAHDEAIKNGGKTIAVLGCGIDNFYLSTNKELFEKIRKNHLLISEYPPNTTAKPEYFPFRNRIIAGISPSLIVTEAHKNSGSLLSVLWALESGRNVFAVPYRTYENSECNSLIKDGAILIESSDDFFNNS